MSFCNYSSCKKQGIIFAFDPDRKKLKNPRALLPLIIKPNIHCSKLRPEKKMFVSCVQKKKKKKKGKDWKMLRFPDVHLTNVKKDQEYVPKNFLNESKNHCIETY